MTAPAWEYSPEYRHECEVRLVAQMEEKRRRDYIDGARGVRFFRGDVAADKLAADVAAAVAGV